MDHELPLRRHLSSMRIVTGWCLCSNKNDRAAESQIYSRKSRNTSTKAEQTADESMNITHTGEIILLNMHNYASKFLK